MGRGLARRGNRHRPHRAGRRPGGLRARPRCTASRCSRRSTRRAASTTPTAGCTGSRRRRRPTRSSVDLGERGFLLEAGTYLHRYPHCWRCDTPLIWRVTDDWLISVEELRQPLLDANATVEWTPAYMGKRMDDWLRNMGDWNISRRRYYGLPLPFYPCACGHLNVIGSKAELMERATGPVDELEELRRPWIDDVRIRCEACGEEVAAHRRGRRRLARRRDRPVLDARLGEPGVRPGGVRDRGGEGADARRPPGPRVLGAVVPGRLGLGDARADPALVLLAALHVGRAHGAGAVPQGARLREDARREGPRDAQLVGEHDRRRRTRSRGWAPT